MGNWLQKILAPPEKTEHLLAQTSRKENLPAQPLKPGTPLPPSLPNATIIYGIGASLLFVASFSLIVAGKWFSGFLVFFLGGCLVALALHLFKHQD
jgi:hypothetical protein